MPLQNIGTVYRKELTDSLRDRRTLISTLLVPLLLFPILSVGFAALAVTLEKKAKEEIPKVMLLGGADSPGALEALRASKKIEVVPATPDWKDKIINKEIRAAVAIPDGFEASLAQQNPQTVEIYKYEGELKSSISADTVEKELKDYRDNVIEARLDANHVPSSILIPFRIKQDNVAPPEKVGGAALGGIIGYMVILLCLTGGMYPARHHRLHGHPALPDGRHVSGDGPDRGRKRTRHDGNDSFEPYLPPRPGPRKVFPGAHRFAGYRGAFGGLHGCFVLGYAAVESVGRLEES